MMRRCVAASLSAVSLLLCASAAWSAAPPRWSCAEEMYEDGVCDCGCDAVDSDCSASTFVGCERSACPDGEVPWEHAPESCMSSACGDGWRDEARGEACDDFEALAGGGCNQDCSAVNVGWDCGDGAEGCISTLEEPDPAPTPEPEPEPEPSPDADDVQPDGEGDGDADSDTDHAGHDAGGDDHASGCAAAGRPRGALWPLAALLSAFAPLARRR